LNAHPVYAALTALVGAGAALEYLGKMGVPGVTPPSEALAPETIFEQLRNFWEWLQRPGLFGPREYQHGGVIAEPTLLYSLSRGFYGIAGEAGREYITPAGGVTVPIYLDGRPFAEYVLDFITRKAKLQRAFWS
jgi:hypothetical protein